MVPAGYLFQKRSYYTLSLVTILGIILLGSFMVYGINSSFSKTLYYFIVALYFLLSRDRVLSVAVIFIIVLNPFGLFYYKPYDWIFTITPSVGISYKIFLSLIILLKYLISVQWRQICISDIIRPYYIVFAGYFIFMIFWGSAFSYSFRTLYDLFLSLSVLSLFLVLPRIFSYDSMQLFNRIIFIFCLIHTFISFVDIFTHGFVTNLLIFGRHASTASVWSEELVRITGGVSIALYSFITGLYYLASRKEGFKAWFLWLVVLTSWFFILNTATRGWMLASLFLFISFSIFYIKRVYTRSRVIIGALIIVMFGLLALPESVRLNLNAAFNRLSTVESVAEGDMTAGGTARRWNVRGPRALTRFEESPVFGFGFSKITSDYWDGHVGNHILLLMGGVVGLVIAWGTIFYIILFLYTLERANNFYTGIFVFGIALMSIMIIHSTNMVMISFVRMPAHSVFIIGMLFNQVNAQINQFKYTNSSS